MKTKNVHTWEKALAHYHSLEEKDWDHISGFVVVLKQIKAKAESMGLYPVTSHEALVLSRLCDYPDFFDKDFIKLTPTKRKTVLIEVFDEKGSKLATKERNYKVAPKFIIDAMNKRM